MRTTEQAGVGRARRRPLAALLLLQLLVATPAAGESLPLAVVMARAIEAAPAIGGGEARIAGARAFVAQAGARPNPTIGVDIQDFAGTDSLRGLRGAQITLEVSQPFELGGKRAARRALAQAEVAVAEIDRDAARRAVMADVLDSYARAAAARARLAIAEEQAALASTIADQTARRLAAGDVAQVTADRAAVDRAVQTGARDRAAAALDVADRALASLVGAVAPVSTTPGWLEAAGAWPAIVRPGLETLPEAARWRVLQARARATLDNERARRGLDPAVNLGVRQLRELDATALVAGVSVALPLNSRNGGAVARARSEVTAADFDIEAARRTLGRALDRMLADDAAARANLRVLDGTSLPAAARVLALTRRGFAAGALPYGELADAARASGEVRLQQVAALEAIARLRAELLGITGAMDLGGAATDR